MVSDQISDNTRYWKTTQGFCRRFPIFLSSLFWDNRQQILPNWPFDTQKELLSLEGCPATLRNEDLFDRLALSIKKTWLSFDKLSSCYRQSFSHGWLSKRASFFKEYINHLSKWFMPLHHAPRKCLYVQSFRVTTMMSAALSLVADKRISQEAGVYKLLTMKACK